MYSNKDRLINKISKLEPRAVLIGLKKIRKKHLDNKDTLAVIDKLIIQLENYLLN